MRLFSLAGLLVAGLPFAASADMALNDSNTWRATLETRLRAETDMDAIDAKGLDVQDRTRLRMRALLGLKYLPNEVWMVEGRLRSGAKEGHQSSHVTIHDFDEGPEGETDVDVDKLYIGAKEKGWWAWAGRNIFPFADTDIALWDSDATLPGVTGGFKTSVSEQGSITGMAGVFALPVGMRDFSGSLAGAEGAYIHDFGNVDVTLGGGLIGFMADDSDPDGSRLPNRSGRRDYTILTARAKAEWKWQELPMKAGVLLFHNAEDYDDASDAFALAHRDERDGAHLHFQIGSNKKKGEWLVAYHYAYIETLAINAYYAPDDWQRWGSGAYADGSDVSGHQFHVGYAFTDGFNALARVFLAEGIDSRRESTRIRLDLNYTF
ncbi:MAG: putative porin [Alphaproteobacteria bacterium]|nr:putative porin [Alphaproteobacteria bacterium]